MRPESTLLLSIRPEFANRIFDGTKTVELRRIRPRLEAGSTVLVYVSAPVMSLVGAFSVSEIFGMSPDGLWRKLGPQTGIARAEFKKYFEGSELAYGIGIQKSWIFSRPCPLKELRQKMPEFQPPQSYWYLAKTTVEVLTGKNLQHIKRPRFSIA